MTKIAAIQMDIKPGNKEKNLSTAIKQIKEAVNQKAHIICLPELFNTGYMPEEMHNLAEEEEGETIKLLMSSAREYNVNILAGSIAVKENSHVFNKSYIINSKGHIAGYYCKTHLFPLMGEDRCFKHGNRLSVAKLEECAIGQMICYDIRFPEIARALALKGAELLSIPAAFPHPRLNHWRILLQARAIENQLYLVAINRVGSDKTGSYFGHSMIIDPWGEILCEAGEGEEVIYGEIEINKINKVRNKIPCFQDRRKDLYSMKSELERDSQDFKDNKINKKIVQTVKES
jgi:predicted amidohydrolase